MADLVTHIATAFAWKAARPGPHVGLLVVGVTLPDLAGRVPTILSAHLARRTGLTPPDALVHGASALHVPLGILAMSWLLSLVVVRAHRWEVFTMLLGGGLLHLALDLTQRHVGVGYPLLHPFSRWHFELGWLGSEATVPWALPALGLSALAWAWRNPGAWSGPGEGRRGRGEAPTA